MRQLLSKEALEAALGTTDKWFQIFAVIAAVGTVGSAFFGVRHWLIDNRLQPLRQRQRAGPS
jgi:hypothetical protein